MTEQTNTNQPARMNDLDVFWAFVDRLNDGHAVTLHRLPDRGAGFFEVNGRPVLPGRDHADRVDTGAKWALQADVRHGRRVMVRMGGAYYYSPLRPGLGE